MTYRALAWLFLALSCPLGAQSPDASDAELALTESEFLKSAGLSWSKVAAGVYESTASASGGVVRAYFGDTGRRLYVSKLRNELLRINPYLYSTKKRTADAAASATAEMQALLDELQAQASKAYQQRTTNYTVCGLSASAYTYFEATQSILLDASASASSTYSGTIPSGQLHLVVTAQLDGQGYYWDSDDRWLSGTQSGTASATVILPSTFGYGCNLQTAHLLNGYACGDIFRLIERTNTCDGVIAETPMSEEISYSPD
jgi:hypothetical protein